MEIPYAKAAQAIRDWILAGKLPPKARLPSARVLARELGFTPCVTHRACTVLISNGVLHRTGYKLFVGAANPSRPPVEGIVYLVSYWEKILKFAEQILTERGVHHRAFELSHTKHRNPRPVLQRLFAQKPAGMLLWMPEWLDGLETAFESQKIPSVICANAVATEAHLHVVGTDIYRSTEKALKHLLELGHRDIAHVTPTVALAIDREIADCYRNVCLHLGLKSSASNIWQVDPKNDAATTAEMLRQHKKHPEVTALFANPGNAEFAKRIFRVPKELSVISMFDSSLTTVGGRGDDFTTILWGCTELFSQIQTLESGLPARQVHHALFTPELIDRGSTRALTRKEQAKTAQDREGERPRKPQSPGSSGDSPSQTVSPLDSWRRSYPFLQRRLSNNWRQFDLSKLANHSMTREHGWLGREPLQYFSPGMRSVHGVPFQVINENLNGGKAVVTFRSPHTHSAKGGELPIKVKLPVGGGVKALYFLHGCGWARPLPFAEYIMHFKNGKTSVIRLVSAGPSLPLESKGLAGLKPNIQDWWPLSKPRDFPHAMHAVVFNPADPMEYERYLYTLEWINPRPKEEVSFIEIRVDPKAGPTLALIAITALL